MRRTVAAGFCQLRRNSCKNTMRTRHLNPTPFIILTAAAGRNQPAVSDQRSAFRLAISIQLLYQEGEHPFNLDGVLGQLLVRLRWMSVRSRPKRS